MRHSFGNIRLRVLAVASAVGAVIVVAVALFVAYGRSPAVPDANSRSSGVLDSQRSGPSSAGRGAATRESSDTSTSPSSDSGKTPGDTATERTSSASGSDGAPVASNGLPVPTDVPAAVGQLADQVVSEIADQLGETVGAVGGALDSVGADLDTVTNDVVELVNQGVPLEDAVNQVLGQLPSLPVATILPSIAPTPSPGLLGGLLG
jgi:hypothetical protein